MRSLWWMPLQWKPSIIGLHSWWHQSGMGWADSMCWGKIFTIIILLFLPLHLVINFTFGPTNQNVILLEILLGYLKKSGIWLEDNSCMNVFFYKLHLLHLNFTFSKWSWTTHVVLSIFWLLKYKFDTRSCVFIETLSFKCVCFLLLIKCWKYVIHLDEWLSFDLKFHYNMNFSYPFR